MKSDIFKLYALSNADERRIIGLMSGTSLDGLDVALCTIKGHGGTTRVSVERFSTIAYTAEFKREVRKIFSVAQGDIELVTLLHSHIGRYHASLILQCLQEWHISPSDVDLIASHGQTIYHAPTHLHRRPGYGHATLQIGDSDHIAVGTGIITLGDFRLKHIAGGGEGAPLAVYGDRLLFTDASENRILLNIGGIANYTWLPSERLLDILPPFSSDVGPGNTMMDAFVQRHYTDMDFDQNAELASQGTVALSLLSQLLDHSFFQLPLPKTIGPELFNLDYLDLALSNFAGTLQNKDILATLNFFAAKAIANSISNVLQTTEATIYVSGGGAHNPLLLRHLSDLMPYCIVKMLDVLGVHPDAKEAVLFAVLANECICGAQDIRSKNIHGVPAISLGKISLPN